MILPNRGILVVSGDDHVDFLQGLVTNDVGAGPAYACLLTAQGRFLHDFFVVPETKRLLVECEADRRDDLLKRLKQFRLRARVEIVDETSGFSSNIAFEDPRHPALGRRILGGTIEGTYKAWDRQRIMLGIPDGSRDMVVGEALLLENNIDRLNGISWDKGCYVGQELTARMHFKGSVKRRLTPVQIDGVPPAPGTAIFSNGVEAGEMRSSCGDIGLALLRVEMAEKDLKSGSANLLPIAV